MKIAPVAAAALVLAIGGPANAATTEVLARDGDVASDGTALNGFHDVVGTGAVVFRGTTTALLTRAGDTFTILLRAGDPLPAPLAGTFARFSKVVINDAGTVAFRAAGTGAATLDGLFLHDAGRTVVVTSAPNQGLLGFDLSNSGHVAFADNAGLWLWTGVATAPTSIVSYGTPAPGGGSFLTIADPVLNAADTVVFHALTAINGSAGVFAWRPATGAARIAEESYPSVAINAAGQIALANDRRVARFDPAGAVTTIVAATRSAGGTLRSIAPEYVGIDSAGNVAFEGRLRGLSGFRIFRVTSAGGISISDAIPNGAEDFALRFTDAGQVVWKRGRRIMMVGGPTSSVLSPADVTPFGRDLAGATPTINAAGVVAFIATRGALYRVDESTLRHVAQAGDLLHDGTTITGVDAYVANGSATAFLAATSADRTVLVVDQDGILRQVAATGDHVGPRGRLELGAATAMALRGRTALFTTSVTSKRGTRTGLFSAPPFTTPRLLLSAGNRQAGRFRFESISAVDAAGRDVILAADPRRGPPGLFLLGMGGTTRIAVAGQPAPGTGRRFDTADFIDEFASRRGRAIFTARLDDERTSGVFLWRNGRLDKLLITGDPLPGGGTADLFTAVGIGDDAEAFVARDRSDGDAIYLVRNGRIVRLVGYGDPTPLGNIGGFDAIRRIAFRGDAVVYGTSLYGATAFTALLATRP